MNSFSPEENCGYSESALQEQKIKEAELEKQLFEYERNATIPDYFHFESDENNFDSGDQD